MACNFKTYQKKEIYENKVNRRSLKSCIHNFIHHLVHNDASLPMQVSNNCIPPINVIYPRLPDRDRNSKADKSSE